MKLKEQDINYLNCVVVALEKAIFPNMTMKDAAILAETQKWLVNFKDECKKSLEEKKEE